MNPRVTLQTRGASLVLVCVFHPFGQARFLVNIDALGSREFSTVLGGELRKGSRFGEVPDVGHLPTLLLKGLNILSISYCSVVCVPVWQRLANGF